MKKTELLKKEEDLKVQLAELEQSLLEVGHLEVTRFLRSACANLLEPAVNILEIA